MEKFYRSKMDANFQRNLLLRYRILLAVVNYMCILYAKTNFLFIVQFTTMFVCEFVALVVVYAVFVQV